MDNGDACPQDKSVSIETDDAQFDAEGLAWGQFEQTLGSVVNRLSHIGQGQFDAVLTGCLRDLAEVLGFDRCTLMECTPFGGGFRVTHSWSGENVPAIPLDSVTDELPWYTGQIRSGHIVCFSSSTALPAEAARERVYALANGVKTNITVPLLIEGLIMGAVGFSCFREEQVISPSLVSRLRLVGEVLALGIRHHQYAEGLESITQTMSQLSLMRRGQSSGQPEQLRHIAAKILQNEHQERLRMGQMLQEDVMQILAGIGLLMKTASSAESKPQADAIQRSIELLGVVLGKLQWLTMQLRPGICPKSLIQNVRWLAGQMKRLGELDVEVIADDAVEPVCDEVGTYIYNAARKILESVAESSDSKHVVLDIRRVSEQWIRLTIINEGIGVIPLSADDGLAGSFDMFSLGEQVELLGGRLEIHHSTGEVAKIVITIRG